ncbi:hypothetical protein BJ138DRAFT_1142674 [Hygrophoropsis aurantiaca]|uniref:Uncharacterized protein n=1 Tax=Hygrophoropsis aurantiaca TaxID=72124 RepID=A0ACB8AQD3_9AGAM|nr:hypothetical protein BJ138DRAFT_1142674 [Hygrophoropsis aurantiaca]
MNPETQKKLYHEGSAIYDSAGVMMMTFTPINQVHQHLCGFHFYAQDPTRHVEAHHFCVHRSEDFHQCIIYDSGEADARLIGIEYIVTEKVFKSLPEGEKKYWHSHKYEVESGLLYLETKGAIPNVINDIAEQPAMLELQQTYGKTIHTWQPDISPELPLGPPQLMMAYTKDGQLDDVVVKARGQKTGIHAGKKKKLREGYLPEYEADPKADQWETDGTGIAFKAEDVSI